jgi:uncharacterized protein YndB with AHSA1/START domain
MVGVNMHGAVGFEISYSIQRPIGDVFEAIYDPEHLCSYFTDKSSGPLRKNETVEWCWESGEREEIRILNVVGNRSIHASWRAYSVDYFTEFIIELDSTSSRSTVVTVSETGWQDDDIGRISAFSHCSGWTDMVLCLRAYLEHGIDLRSRTN